MLRNFAMATFQVGEKVAHLFCEMSMNTDELRKIGAEVFNFAKQIDDAAAKNQDQTDQPVEETKPAE